MDLLGVQPCPGRHAPKPTNGKTSTAVPANAPGIHMHSTPTLQTAIAATCLLMTGLPLAGCAAMLDRAVVERVVVEAARVPDVDKACALGQSLGHAISSVGNRATPHRAILIAEVTSAFCSEGRAWESELDASRARTNLEALGEARIAEATDASLVARRAHVQAARRFFRAYQQVEPRYGQVGQDCPALSADDQLVYLLGLFAGLQAVLHDRAGSAQANIPLDILPPIARASRCLDDATWWYVPSAMQASVQAMLPSAAPSSTNPWNMLEASASRGESSGVRLARALQVRLSAIADHGNELADGIRSFAASRANTPQDPAWALLDEYARTVVLHESDLLWTSTTGHRTPVLGELPPPLSNVAHEPRVPGVFGVEDPFAPVTEPQEPPENSQ